MNIRIEKVHPSNDDVCQFIASEYLKMFLELNPHLKEPYSSGEIGRRLSQNFIDHYIEKDIFNDSVLYSAFLDEEMVGALQFDRNDHLSCLFVKEEYRNQLIGSRLLERLISDCKNLGVITVDARIDAISLYEKFSFKIVDGVGSRTFIPMELEMNKRGK